MSTDRIAQATRVLEAFVEANGRQDADAMVACLTRSTIEAGGFSGPTPPNVQFRMGEGQVTDAGVVIPMHVMPVGDPDAPVLDTLQCVMVEEDGAWKFDLLATISPKMAQVEAAMDAAMGALGEAMGGAMEAMGDTMSAAFGDGGSANASAFGGHELVPSTYDSASLLPRSDEWIDLPPLRPLPALTAGVSEACAGVIAREIPVRCDLASLLGLFGSDDESTLLNWLDTDFCPGLAAAVELATRVVPTQTTRLRAIRIEASGEWMERCLVLDGPDLVYRVDLRNPDGWYTGDELAQHIPGVLAALPEDWDQYPDIAGILPPNSHQPSLDLYRDVVAPRLMRRISSLVGAPLALDLDWEVAASDDQTTRGLWSWGLNRILGAVALAYPQAGDRPPEGWLHTIRIGFSPFESDRRASSTDGLLDMVIAPRYGEKACLTEQQLCNVLCGETFAQATESPTDEAAEAPPE